MTAFQRGTSGENNTALPFFLMQRRLPLTPHPHTRVLKTKHRTHTHTSEKQTCESRMTMRTNPRVSSRTSGVRLLSESHNSWSLSAACCFPSFFRSLAKYDDGRRGMHWRTSSFVNVSCITAISLSASTRVSLCISSALLVAAALVVSESFRAIPFN